MMIKKISMYIVGIIFLTLVTFSCSKKEVVITKDYVINPHWDKNDNSFEISKMIVVDSTKVLNLDDIVPAVLMDALADDTTFGYVTNVRDNGEDYSTRKVYFNQPNEFTTWHHMYDRRSSNSKQVFGELEPETWYYIGGLDAEKTLYYIYIDKVGVLHKYRVPASAWTNF